MCVSSGGKEARCGVAFFCWWCGALPLVSQWRARFVSGLDQIAAHVLFFSTCCLIPWPYSLFVLYHVMSNLFVSLFHCTDSLWRWHSSAPSGSKFSHCWPGGETVAAAVEEGAVKAAAASREDACLEGDDDSTGGTSAACAASPTADASSPETPGLDPRGDAAVGWGGSAAVDAEGLLDDTVLLSLSGGLKDLMVHPSLCVADGLGLEGQSVSLTTEAMEGCGFGVDHLALVWCKQLVGRWALRLKQHTSIDPRDALLACVYPF